MTKTAVHPQYSRFFNNAQGNAPKSYDYLSLYSTGS